MRGALLFEVLRMAAGLHDVCPWAVTHRSHPYGALYRRVVSVIERMGLRIGASACWCRADANIPGCNGWHGCRPLLNRRCQWAVHHPFQHEGRRWSSLRSHGNMWCGSNHDLYGSPLSEAAHMDAGLCLAELRHGFPVDTVPCSGHDYFH